MPDRVDHPHPTIPYLSADPTARPIRASFVALYIAVFFAVGLGLAGLAFIFDWLTRR